MAEMDDRKTFLIEMYNQMFADINRHILVVWQSIGVIGGTVAFLALAEKKVLPMNYAMTIIVIVCFWSINTIIESGYWYNRNNAIIANIERQFLNDSDITDIMYYFGKHRAPRLIVHLKIQLFLISAFLVLFLVHHLRKYLIPYFNRSCGSIETIFPWVALLVGIIVTWVHWKNRQEAYANFLEHSPGRGVEYKISSGPGHQTK